MEVRRKAVAACVVAAALAALTGCGGDDGEPASAGAEKPDPVRVAVVMASLDNDFYVAQKEGVEEEAAKQSGADVSVTAGRQRSSTDEVIGLIEDAMAKGVDAIAVNGSDTKPLLPVLERVIAAKIPLVLFDAPAEDLKGRYTAYIGTDNRAGGEAGGQWLAEAMPDGGRLGVLLCVAGHPVTTARLEGFKSGLGDVPFKIVATADAECDRAKGRKVMEDMISAHPDLDAVFSTSDSHTLGALSALEAAGKDPAFVSFDAQPEAVKAIQAGKVLDASVAWSARTIGSEAVKAAVAAARGEQVEPETMVPVTVVDAENAADWKG
jgi:ABC-type sugar transport system substrate-binding protein